MKSKQQNHLLPGMLATNCYITTWHVR